MEASGAGLSLNEVCPYRFAAPMAPAEAAMLEGRAVSFDRLIRLYRSLAARHDLTLVEGAGGLLVPFADEKTTADLIRCLDLPVIVVARIGLGTINHTCLTLEAIQRRGLEVLGLIFTRTVDPHQVPPGPDEARNPATIERLSGIKVLANLPYSPTPPPLELAPW
jgi:dethiobiotin synthetase